MFERPHHQRIARVLDSLDAAWLAQHGCLFGGGTAIALSHGEYRESVDVDFLVSASEGYRALRERVRSAAGIVALGRPGHLLRQAREVRVDQYGIRTFVIVDNQLIKFEIVREARIELSPPVDGDRICGVARLTTVDLATSKLLALADRWTDDSVHSRDLIDLAMMNLPRRTLQQAKAKAGRAYSSIERDLELAIEALHRRPGRLEACATALQMTTPLALMMKRIKRLPERARA